MQRNVLAATLAALFLSGCYRVTVITGAPPAPQTIDRPWQHSFVHGLVPPAEIAAQAQCPQGVASVMTERSFVNGLVSFLTWNIYTPIHATVTCSTSPTPQ